jgi:hypothetical protein
MTYDPKWTPDNTLFTCDKCGAASSDRTCWLCEGTTYLRAYRFDAEMVPASQEEEED